MAVEYNVAYRTLLTSSEYELLIKQFEGCPSNSQTNYYFDTKRFTLKASDITLRVKRKDSLQIGLKRKKNYNQIDIPADITEKEFQEILDTGVINIKSISQEIAPFIKDQLLVNYLTLTTYRIFLPYKHGILAIDKVDYLGMTDYELEFQASNAYSGKDEFVQTVKELGIKYKKAEPKLKRAFNELKNQ